MPFEDYKILLASRPENETHYELITITHSLLSKAYYFVIDTRDVISNGITYEKANIKVSRAVNSNDLNQSMTFTIGDVANVLDSELDNIPLDNNERPMVNYKIVLSTDLDNPVEDINFDVESVPQKKGVFTMKTGVTDLNKLQTGDRYTYRQFPMLRTAGL